MTRRVLFAAVFFSLAWTTLPALVNLTRKAVDMRRLSMDQRRAKVMGPFYDSVLRLNRSIPRGETVAIVLPQRFDINPALFFNYYAYPRRTRIYDNLRAYRDAPERPRRIIRADENATEQLREMTYEQFRAAVIGKDHVSGFELPEDTIREGIVPVAASVRGAGPDVFTTEAVMANPSSVPVRVTVEILPFRRTAEIVLEPQQQRTWNDFVYEVFDVMDQGWVRFRADAPVRARFWFVNRGRRDAAPLPFLRPVTRAELDAPLGSRLWVVNPNAWLIGVFINDDGHVVQPLNWSWLPKSGPLVIKGESPFVVFVSWRDSDGRSHFAW
jgi:hypothetical protein